MCNEPSSWFNQNSEEDEPETLVREDISLRVPIDGRRSGRHGDGDLKERQQTTNDAKAAGAHFCCFFLFLVFFTTSNSSKGQRPVFSLMH